MLASGVLHQLGYMAALVFQARADVPGATAFDSAEPVIVAAFVAGAGLLLHSARAGTKKL